MRKLLFSVSAKDFEIQTFTCGGKGGSGKDTSNNGVRLIHPPSGARAEARDSRNQNRNKQAAFLRLLETKEWKLWHKLEVAKQLGYVQKAEDAVAVAMDPQNLKIEVQTKEGWKEE